MIIKAQFQVSPELERDQPLYDNLPKIKEYLALAMLEYIEPLIDVNTNHTKTGNGILTAHTGRLIVISHETLHAMQNLTKELSGKFPEADVYIQQIRALLTDKS